MVTLSTEESHYKAVGVIPSVYLTCSRRGHVSNYKMRLRLSVHADISSNARMKGGHSTCLNAMSIVIFILQCAICYTSSCRVVKCTP